MVSGRLILFYIHQLLFLAADLARTAAGLSVVLAQQSGTRWQMTMNLEIPTASIDLNGFWKQSSIAATIVWPAH